MFSAGSLLTQTLLALSIAGSPVEVSNSPITLSMTRRLKFFNGTNPVQRDDASIVLGNFQIVYCVSVGVGIPPTDYSMDIMLCRLQLQQPSDIMLRDCNNLLQPVMDSPRIALNGNKWTWKLHGLKSCQATDSEDNTTNIVRVESPFNDASEHNLDASDVPMDALLEHMASRGEHIHSDCRINVV
ncbi:hypothetical protein BDR04DRAFT_1159667 [Suillus decipiens]|nr:hypothetical protein BDR04DRAFT_1159667 [Suillus decipiens]